MGAELSPLGEPLNTDLHDRCCRSLRSNPKTQDTPISIDTFHHQVAAAAVEAGADLVNDVTGGSLDPQMFSTVARLGVPYVLMHMRGTPQDMQSKEHTTYDCIWRQVGDSLRSSAEAAMAAGIPAWNIILDPGIGFAKQGQGSLELLRNLLPMRQQCFTGPLRHAPMLVGVSRKGFLGTLTGRKDAKDRDVATVAASVMAVAQGTDIVRVHNVGAAVDGMKVADALNRPRPSV